MNYIWDLVIKAERSGLAKQTIKFSAARIFSPYLELSLKYLNTPEVPPQVEVNPYYGYYEIFKELFDINNSEETELRNTLFDIIIHFLADIDRNQGLNKRDYYLKFILQDIEAGLFGKQNSVRIKLFDRDEKEIIAGNILRLYELGEAVYLLTDTLRKIFKKPFIYANPEEKDELIIYIDQKESRTAQEKMELIKEFFVPVRFQTEIYWKNHFGIIGLDEIMRIDDIVLY